MIITCNNCQTIFEIPSEDIDDVKVVQCSVCEYKWTLDSDTIASKTLAQEQDVIVDKMKTQATKRPKKTKVARKSSIRTWPFLLSLVILLIVVFLGFRSKVIRTFPVTVPLYEKMDYWYGAGMDKLSMMTLEDKISDKVRATVVRASLSSIGERRVLSIKGLVRNTSDEVVHGVALNAELRDKNGVVLKIISFRLSTVLKAGQAEKFKITVPEPPIKASDIQIIVSN